MKTIRQFLTSVAILGLVSGGALAEATAKKAPANPSADGGSSSAPSGHGSDDQGQGTHGVAPASQSVGTASGNDAGKSSRSHGSADEGHSGKGAGSKSGVSSANGSAVTIGASKPLPAPSSGVNDADLNPVFPPNHVPLAGIHRGHTPVPVGGSLVKKTPKGTPAPAIATTTKSTAKPGATPHAGPMAAAEASSTKTVLKPHTAPMALGESASNKTAVQTPAHPMVEAESAALHKMSGPDGKLEPVVKENVPDVAKASQPLKPVASVPPRSTISGTSASLQHGQPLPLSAIGGIQSSKTVKHTASLNGTTFR